MIRRTDRGSTIYVAKSLSATHQRFTIAHELAHYLLHFRHVSGPSHCIDRTDVYELYRHPAQANEREREANRWAAEWLMPTLVVRALAQVYTPKHIAEFLAVPQEALTIRWSSMDGPRPL